MLGFQIFFTTSSCRIELFQSDARWLPVLNYRYPTSSTAAPILRSLCHDGVGVYACGSVVACVSTIKRQPLKDSRKDSSRITQKNKFVRPPRWPYDMRPSARAEKYIRDAGP